MNQALPRSKFFKLKQLTIHIHEWGEAKSGLASVMLLHATGFHGRCWDMVVHALQHHHVIAVDLRGHGKSDHHAFDHWGDFGNDIIDLIVAMSLKDVVLVGHSLGGVAAAYAAFHLPNPISKLMLVDPVILPPEIYHAHEIDLEANGNIAKKRRDQFVNAEELFSCYIDRPPFTFFELGAFQSFCDHALHWNEDENRFQLACRPDFEASVYVNIFSFKDIYKIVEELPQKTYILRAMPPPSTTGFHGFQYSPTNPNLVGYFKDGMDIFLAQHSHFIPQQDSVLTAHYIRKLIDE